MSVITSITSSAKYTAAQTVTASSAYTSGDAVGGKISLTGVRSNGSIQRVVLRDEAGATNVETNYTLYLFDADPSAATITNKTTFVFSTDLAKCIAAIDIAGSKVDATGGIYDMQNMDIDFVLASSGTTLYGALVVTGTPTFGSTSDISLDVYVR